jgi:hypothetical protein
LSATGAAEGDFEIQSCQKYFGTSRILSFRGPTWGRGIKPSGRAGCFRSLNAAWCALIAVTMAGALVQGAQNVNDSELYDQIRHDFSSRSNGSAQVFSSRAGAISFTRSTNFWLRGLNGLTGIHAGDGPGATAITRWHVIGANHWKHDSGSKLCFCDLKNHVVTRTVIVGTEVRPDLKSDIWLAVLNEALPASIAPVAMMPEGWLERLRTSQVLVAAMNQVSSMGIGEMISRDQPVRRWFRYGLLFRATEIYPSLSFRPLRTGDSGYPIVTIVENDFVLLSHLTLESGMNFLGPDYSRYAQDIQKAISVLGTNQVAQAEKIHLTNLTRFR